MDDQRGMTVAGTEAEQLRLRQLPRPGSASARPAGHDRGGAASGGPITGRRGPFPASSLCSEAERRLAQWLGVEDTLIYPQRHAGQRRGDPGGRRQGRPAGGRPPVARQHPAGGQDRRRQRRHAPRAAPLLRRTLGKHPGKRAVPRLRRGRGRGVQHDGQDPALGRTGRSDAPRTAARPVRGRCPRHRRGRSGRPRRRPHESWARSDQVLMVGLALEGVFLHGGLRHLHRRTETGAQDALQHVHFRRAGAAPLPGRHLRPSATSSNRPNTSRCSAALQQLIERLTEGIRSLGPERSWAARPPSSRSPSATSSARWRPASGSSTAATTSSRPPIPAVPDQRRPAPHPGQRQPPRRGRRRPGGSDGGPENPFQPQRHPRHRRMKEEGSRRKDVQRRPVRSSFILDPS